MSTEQQLESYLEQLNKNLGQIPISERADIITEIKSHVLEAQERDPSQSISSILASLGEPESVANKYLLERGLSTKKPSKTPMVKWLVVGFLGTFSLLLLTLIVILWKFTPLIAVNGEEGSVKILGGAIQIRDKGPFDIEDYDIESIFRRRTFTKSEAYPKNKITTMRFLFASGKANIKASENDRFKWSCEFREKNYVPAKKQESGVYELDVRDAKKSDCEIEIPKGMSIEVMGTNGKIELDEIQSDANVTLTNGKVQVNPSSKENYTYDVDLRNGSMDRFESSANKDALKIKVSLTNGKISKG